MKKTNARHQSASRTINRFNPGNEQTTLNETGPLWGRGTVCQKRMEYGKGTEMIGELTKRSFEVPALLERHNAFEQEVCRTVFQDKYSSSVKTYHVIDHLISRGEELGLMGVPSYLAAIEALKRFSSYHAGLIRGFAGERRVFYAIKHVGPGFEQLVNAELDYEGEHDEFDQILVSRQGLVIVEVKNYSSSAAIGSDGILRFEDGSGRMRNVGERMASKRYVLREVLSDAIGRELPDERIVSLVVNANEKTFIRNDSDRVEVQSTGSIARRVEELLRGDEVLGAEDVSAIKAALEAAHHPIEIEPEIDFEYVSATLHEALSLIARSVAEEKEDEDFARVSAPESETCSVSQAQRPSPALISGAVALLLGLAGGYVLGSTGKWR